MPVALYFPFSRCLDEIALKQAVLLYDKLLFVDPVSPQARHDLYVHEARAAGADPRITQAWVAAADHYELLAREGIVETVDASVLQNPDRADTLVADGLAVDLDLNRAGAMFRGRRRWQMLEARLPPSALEGRFKPRPGPAGWHGDQVVEVPYAVGSSVTLTYALAIAHEAGAVPLTDSDAHHRLLLRRMATAAASDDLPGLRARPPSAYRRRQIEVRIVNELAPAAALQDMNFDQLLEYRRKMQAERRELNQWIDQLADKARNRPWDPALDAELEGIAEHARLLAARPERWGAAVAAARATVSPGRIATDVLGLVGAPTLAAVIAPQVSLLAALAVGANVARRNLVPATRAAIDELVRRRTPEQNAVSYLLNARRR
jgi:hypothetical protein